MDIFSKPCRFRDGIYRAAAGYKKCMKNPRNVYLDIQALEAMPTGCQEVETGMNPAVDGRGSKQDVTVCKTIVFFGTKGKRH